MRALARLVDDGLVRRVGVANVTRTQLDEALELAPIAAVQVALSPFDDRALRGGVVARCAELGLPLIAHSPLGGPRRAGTLARRDDLAAIAARHDATPAEAALGWLLGLSPEVVAIPGARRPETARSAARAAALRLGADDQASLTVAFGGGARRTRAAPRDRPLAGEVVIVMGIPGAGKSRLAADYVERGYARLNRDERGGSLRALADELDEQLAAGVRADRARQHVSDARGPQPRHRDRRATRRRRALRVAATRRSPRPRSTSSSGCSSASARSLRPNRSAPPRANEPWLMLPTSADARAARARAAVGRRGFRLGRYRAVLTGATGAAAAPACSIGAAATERPGLERALASADPAAPHLIYDWRPGGDAGALAGRGGARREQRQRGG